MKLLRRKVLPQSWKRSFIIRLIACFTALCVIAAPSLAHRSAPQSTDTLPSTSQAFLITQGLLDQGKTLYETGQFN